MTLDAFIRDTLAAAQAHQLPTWDVLGHAMHIADKRGTWVEFGVADGTSLVRLDAHRGEAELWGFDSFEGLPEDWREGHPKGEFAQAEIPKPPEGVRLVVGRFEETLPNIVLPSITLAHVDCDLYSSTMCVLDWMTPPIGAVIVFDEIIGYPGFEQHEILALYESGIRIEWFAAYAEKMAGRVVSL